MKCPVCNDTHLVMAERQGVEIDYCPNCRGIWLDRGELDKILERSAGQSAAPTGPRTGTPGHHDSDHNYHSDRDDYSDGGHGTSSKKKKGGLLGDIFGGLGGD